jgi:general secretion pathway protein B
MSFILDALRKSESERQREAAPTLTRAAIAPSRRGTPAWSWLIIAALSAALLALVAIVLDSGPAEPDRPAASPQASPQALPQEVAPAFSEPAVAVDPDAPPRPLSDLASMVPELPDYVLEFVAFDNSDPNKGSAWINGRRYFAGERLGGELTLTEIRPDGVVLAYRGQSFLLRL